MISEGQSKVDKGNELLNKAWTADAIGKGHAYKDHANKQGKGEFKAEGINGSGTADDKEKFVSLITDIMTSDKSEHKDLDNGREAYWDDKTGTVVIVDPNSADKGTAFKPKDGKQYYDELE